MENIFNITWAQRFIVRGYRYYGNRFLFFLIEPIFPKALIYLMYYEVRMSS